MNFLARLSIALLLSACSVSETEVEEIDPIPEMVWPAAPAPARIRLEQVIDEPRDLGIRQSAIGQVWAALAGEKATSMVRPYAVDVREGNVLVGDPGSRMVYLFDQSKRRMVSINSADRVPLRSPVGVAFAERNFYVADSALGTVFLFDVKGRLLDSIEGLERPTGLAWDQESRRLFVAETLAHRITVFDESGSSVLTIGGRGADDGQFNFPSHLAIARNRLLVNDTMNFRVQVFDTGGVHLQTFGKHGDGSGQFSHPKGLTMDSQGHIYVAGATIDRVQIFAQSGEFLLAFGGVGNGPGQFTMPAGLAIENDVIYVADSYNRRIQVFRYVGGK